MAFARAPYASTLFLAAAVVAAAARADNGDDRYATQRHFMIQEIVSTSSQAGDLTGRPTLDTHVLEIMDSVPRHEFVPEPLQRLAYLNRPLPIGHGQTVSQPYIVALMTDLARIGHDDTVMVLGIGGGYQAAIAARLAGNVRCVEMFEPVARGAVERLSRLGYDNVDVRVGDPYYGWRGGLETFDAIIVRQAMAFVPEALIDQLKRGGRLVMPLGTPDMGQFLTVIRKNADGTTAQHRILPVLFTQMPGGPRI